MSTKINLTPNTLLSTDDEPVIFRQFVIYASSQAVDVNGHPLQEIPLDLVDDDEDGGAVARAMIEASETFTADDGWLIERRDAEIVPASDMALLVERLAREDEWDEYIGVDCQRCGDTGVVDACEAVDGKCVAVKGDCPNCGVE